MRYSYEENHLHWNGVDLEVKSKKIKKYLKDSWNYTGPFYLYNGSVIEERLELFDKYLPDSRFYYSVKSLSNLHILRKIRNHSRFGVDVVSGGEILRALKAGFQGDQIVYAGVGKTGEEIALGLKHHIKSFHVESLSEILHIEKVAGEMGLVAPVTLRLNPNIEVDTHAYITTGKEENKFGISLRELDEAVTLLKSPHLKLTGLQAHLGSQILDVKPYLTSIDFLSDQATVLENSLQLEIEYLSLGGGFGIDYSVGETIGPDMRPQTEFPIEELGKKLGEKKLNWQIDFEPGRFISGYSGMLIMDVLYIKQKNGCAIAIVNAGMNDMIRPALYEAKHPVLPVCRNSGEGLYDVVGPVCESGDFFVKKYPMSQLKEGDTLALLHAGAYGSVMSSNYNSRPLVPEILLENDGFRLIRRPQKFEDIFSFEEVV